MNELPIKEAPTAEDRELYRQYTLYQVREKNNLDPPSYQQWDGVERRKAERRQYVFGTLLTETALTWKEELFICGVFLVAVGLFALAMMEVRHLWNGS